MLHEHLLLLEQKDPLLTFKLRGMTASLQQPQGSLSIPMQEGKGVLFIYAATSLSSLEEIHLWLKAPNRKVVLLEKTPADLLCFLSLEQAHHLLKHPAFSCHLMDEWPEELFLKIAWESLFLPSYFVTALGHESVFVQFREKMEYYLDLTTLIASEYCDDGKRVIGNFYRNSMVLHTSKKGNSLKFQKLPAVVCGAGPSIASQLGICHTLRNKALLFMGGSLLSICAKAGVIPHFGAIVDPDPLYERFRNCDLFEMPILYQIRASHEILQLMHGPKVLSAGSGEWPLEEYFFSALEEVFPSLESGWNVANFMATVAAEMGCSPIILLGMDMCYKPDQEYVAGVEGKEEKAFININGTEVVSRKDLLMGRHFFSTLVERYPDTIFINATAEGLPIEGMQHRSFNSVIEEFSTQYDLAGLMHSHRLECEEVVGNKTLFKKTVERLQKSFQATLEILTMMLSKLEHRKHSCLVLEEIELEEEPIYQTILYPLWQIWKWVLFREEQTKEHTLEGKVQKILFFQRVTKDHKRLFDQVYKTGI